jgi:ribosomal protein S18 acetylase RimI-like enzyme
VARVEPISVDVQPARYADLARLSDMPDTGFFADRFERQKNGRGVLFIAWLHDEPVGDVYLWLEDAEESLLRKNLPGVALLTHLEVFPGYRDLGIGTRIIEVAERHLNGLGRRRAALAVRKDNERAARLYHRLGYTDWGHGLLVCFADVTCPGGRSGVAPELCHVLARELDDHNLRSARTLSSWAPG